MTVSPEIKAAHRIQWWAIPFGMPYERIRRNRMMPASCWGWDATCSCGWDSRTGGAIQAWVRTMIDEHRSDAEFYATHTWTGQDWIRKGGENA